MPSLLSDITANIANVIKKSLVLAGVFFWTFVAGSVCAQGFLEIPGPNSTQTGIGIVSGWHCSANHIEIVIDGGAPLLAGSHTSRGDTLGVCGRTDTGFSLLFNWNLLPFNCFGCSYHRVVALADGVEFASTEFQVENFGYEYITGKSAQYGITNFPEIGHMTWLRWDEAKQNFSVYLTAAPPANFPGAQIVSTSGTYYGALRSGKQNPICGPFPMDRVFPVKHGSFIVEHANGQIALTAQYVDGTMCRLSGVPIQPFSSNNNDGNLRALFDQAATASCPEFPGGLDLRVNGQRLIADSMDNCKSAHVIGAQ